MRLAWRAHGRQQHVAWNLSSAADAYIATNCSFLIPEAAIARNFEDIARMEEEMEALGHDLKAVEESYGENVLNLTLARGYIKKLLDNAKVIRFLTANHPDILSEFEAIVAAESL